MAAMMLKSVASTQIFHGTLEEALDHLVRVLLSPLGQLETTFGSFNATVLHLTAALLLAEDLHNARTVCPQTGLLLHWLPQRGHQTNGALVEADLIGARELHLLLEDRSCPRTGTGRMFEAEQPLSIVLVKGAIN